MRAIYFKLIGFERNRPVWCCCQDFLAILSGDISNLWQKILLEKFRKKQADNFPLITLNRICKYLKKKIKWYMFINGRWQFFLPFRWKKYLENWKPLCIAVSLFLSDTRKKILKPLYCNNNSVFNCPGNNSYKQRNVYSARENWLEKK